MSIALEDSGAGQETVLERRRLEGWNRELSDAPRRYHSSSTVLAASHIRRDTPGPVTSLIHDALVMKDSGQVLVSAERCKQKLEYKARDGGEATKNGPYVSFIPN
ncbi:hypothetical protein DPMN_047039 [Dreissena polymorpha]|uniref:Uncharacterized protein n=1 Tax=Dreissena polymorpha TaxID=45954 RepID=A0A9D4HYR7_DREPO|nr:hypothetical protein DPMN_047039 [Dreissena polymorpha]